MSTFRHSGATRPPRSGPDRASGGSSPRRAWRAFAGSKGATTGRRERSCAHPRERGQRLSARRAARARARARAEHVVPAPAPAPGNNLSNLRGSGGDPAAPAASPELRAERSARGPLSKFTFTRGVKALPAELPPLGTQEAEPEPRGSRRHRTRPRFPPAPSLSPPPILKPGS